MKAIELKDILKYKYLSDPRFSPEGKRAAFVVSNANEEENCYESRLWLFENGKIKPLTDLGKERGFTWLDDERLMFPAVRSASEKKRAEKKEEFTSYYVLDVTGGEAMPFFELPFAAGDIKVLDAEHFAVSASVDKLTPELWKAGKEEREAAVKKREEEKDYEVFDEIPFWFNGRGVINGNRSILLLVSLRPFEIKQISALPETVESFEVLGDEVIYAVSRRGARMDLYGFAVKAVNWKTGEIREIMKNDDLMLNGMQIVGDKIWMFCVSGKRYGLNENDWVYTLDPASGEFSVLIKQEYSLYNSVGSDVRYGGGQGMVPKDGSLYHLTTREGNCFIHRFDPSGEDVPVITAEGSVDAFDLCEGRALAVALYDMLPQELYLIDLATGKRERLSHFNDEALEDRYVAKPEPVSTVSEGLEINGWVLLPKDYDPEKTYPAVFDIHGGPKTVYGPVFYHEMQLWASMGYFVFFCNPKGSDGRDNAFADIFGDYGGTDYKNLMDFADAVLKAYPQIDPARVCETGGSYGGFMSNWIIGHTDRFCCVASQRSISNWLSFYGVSDIGYFFVPDQTRGDIFTDPQKMWEQSPLKYAANVKTPTLFIHSDEDYRCPLEQGLQMYTALVDRGVEARLCLFHGENHELSRSGKPKHRVRRLTEITNWFEKYSAVRS